MEPVRFEYLNHASMLVHLGPTRILFDPWFSGTAFSGGWGLRYDNADAQTRAATATHLWISHWHSDHLHGPTLSTLARDKPDVIVLANTSHNFSMVERLSGLGFRDVRPFPERTTVELAGGVSVTRYPTAGIDNMLHLRRGGFAVLNYNDCNLPLPAARALRRRLGPIDVLLTNYNHAGKLFERLEPRAIKDRFYGAFERVVDAFAPRVAIPFASSHYYRTEASRDQNASLLSFDEMEARSAGDRRKCVLRVGDIAEVDTSRTRISHREPAIEPAGESAHDHGEPVPWQTLTELVTERSRALGRAFFMMSRAVPDLDVRLLDHQRVLRLRLGASPVERDRASPAHIATHSRALADWHGRAFGDDTFFAGAHFALEGDDATAVRRWAIVTLLAASHLDPVSVLRDLQQAGGRRFYWNRREEIVATLLGMKLRAGDLRT